MLKVIILNNNFSIYKESFQALIKEIKLLSDYTAVNLESFQKVSIKKSQFLILQILKKQKKAVKEFAPKSDLKTRFERHLLEVFFLLF